jgi:alpha-L-fucosidase 2
MYSGEVSGWKKMLSKMPPYLVNGDGAVKEWARPDLPDHYEHRHASHIYAAFPGHEIGRDHALYPAFRKAVELRLSRGMSSQSGWSLMHHANIFARWRDGDAAMEVLRRFAQSCIGPNFLAYHNDWRGAGLTLGAGTPPFQIDGNMGWTSAVQEILLASEPGGLFLLPALPATWKQGEIAGLRARGGITVSIRWNTTSGVVEAMLRADRDQTVDVRFPARIVHLEATGIKPRGDEIRGLALKAGQQRKLTAKVDMGLPLG